MPTLVNTARSVRRSYFGGLPRAFWLLFSGQLVNRIGGMVLPFLVFYLDDVGLGAAEMGAVVAAVGLGDLIGHPIGGSLADRVGRRFTAVTGMVGVAASLAALGVASGFWPLAATATALGAFSAVPRPAIAALVTDLVDPARRTQAFGLLYWAINLGAAVAGVSAAVLAPIGFWLLFLVDGLTCATFALILRVGLPRDRPPPGRSREASPGYAVVLRDRLLVAFVLLVLAYSVVFGQMQFGLPLALRDDELPASWFGALYTLNALLVTLLQPGLTAWLSRFEHMRVLATSWLTVAVGLSLTGLADTVWQYAATVVLWTLGEIGAASFAAALVAELAPPGAHGRYQAALGWAMGMSRLVSPVLAGFVYTTFGASALWTGCLALGASSAIGGVLLGPAVRRRKHRDATEPGTGASRRSPTADRHTDNEEAADHADTHGRSR